MDDRGALVALIEAAYRQHGHLVLRRARRLLGNEQDAREILQDVFASLLDAPGQLDGKGPLVSWLYGATTHACLNRIRDRKNRLRLLDTHVAPMQEESAAPRAEQALLTRELLARLPVDLAQVAVHYYSDEMTHEEIARVMGCSRRHVGDLLERLKATLSEQMREGSSSP
ncbi:ECF family RNA polymerase sigma factor [Sorangium cellulosum]|uniref:ECF family RNA polymerase sigma factor n=1 Tax=Sorangium cellulosum TaxID=56 RepID=A0A2L0F5W0_SORCE|nr:sigma-70 family RNA polymerase sigma factor [Sorangium cellulosum]AUX46978.1 ECF family RNA polymerase sigma factor [Sorangium cellulosum]